MSIFQSLLNNANDSVSLDTYIQQNYAKIEAFCSTNVDSQRRELDDFDRFVLLKTGVIEKLDYTKSHNRGFVYYLMDYSERFCSTSAIVQLYHIIQDNKLNIGSRLDAAMLYLYNVPSNETFVDRFEDICQKIQTAINEEDDTDKKAIASFLNYYSYVVYNTSEQFSSGLFLKYKNAIETDSFPFLKNDIIQECLALDFHKQEELYSIVQKKIDAIFGRNEKYTIQPNRENDYLIESDTDYARILEKTLRTFQAIRNVSVQQINQFENKDDIYYSLGRGVKILEEETQLFSYLSSYGNMHESKMLLALHELPEEELEDKNIEIYDWACGQGLASMTLLENKANLNVEYVTLIEPSEIALRRATLHVKHFKPQLNIRTVLKDFDSLSKTDVKSSIETVKIHLFSNILDCEKYNIDTLKRLISETQKGLNYFICVSPYITDVKTCRIDNFVSYFHNNDSFHLYYRNDKIKGSWINGWSCVIRVFKVRII